MTTKETDEIETVLSVNNHDNLLFFTDKGKVFKGKVWELEESSRQSKGQAVINLIDIKAGIQAFQAFKYHVIHFVLGQQQVYLRGDGIVFERADEVTVNHTK